MNKRFALIGVIATAVLAIWWGGRHGFLSSSPKLPPGAQSGGESMDIKSSAFSDNASIPPVYTCDGDNHNPPLSFSGIPAAAQSLALIMEDPDVPKDLKPDGMFDHWVVFNMPPTTMEIVEHTSPPGLQGNNGAGKPQYTGPCPPDREHRYFFKLYALDTMLDLPAGSSKAKVEEAVQGHILSQAELVGRYNKMSNP